MVSAISRQDYPERHEHAMKSEFALTILQRFEHDLLNLGNSSREECLQKLGKEALEPRFFNSNVDQFNQI